MTSVAFQRWFARFHLGVYQRTGGRLGDGLSGNPSLVLTTVGRRSGERRRTVLVYARHGDDLVVVASNYGGDKPPAWLLNLREQPRVEVLVGRRLTAATAREVTAQDPAYPELWRLVNANNHNRYDGHQRETSRPIPLVVITPDA
jgi:deazaflavin-dependent oxidoreductase (nitroreductase family)